MPASELFAGRRRLDGYYYNPVAESAAHALAKSRKKPTPLGGLVQTIFNVPRFKHIYTRTGTPYLDSEDIFKINPELTKFIPEPTGQNADRIRRKMAKYYVRRGWLLMACSGQIYGVNGSVLLADRWHENKIVSNHILRIVPKDEPEIPTGYLQMALGHPTLGRPLVVRYAFGTEVPEIDPLDIAEFPVPRIKPASEQAIAELIEQASALRMDADEKENQAVESVQSAIRDLLGETVSTELIEPEAALPPVSQKHA